MGRTAFVAILAVSISCFFLDRTNGWYTEGYVAVGAVADFVFFTTVVQNYLRCYNLCASMYMCKSLNYFPGTGTCQLTTNTSSPIPGSISVYMEFNTLPRQVPHEICRARPCKPEELCVMTTSGNGYICLNYKTAIPCEDPEAKIDMTASTATYTLTGAHAKYACAEGYNTVDGTGDTHCSLTNWTQPSLKCEIVDCNTLTPQPNMAGSASITTYGTSASYSCVDGYNGTEDGTSTCQADGTWTIPALTCTVVDCGSPSSRPHTSSTSTATLFGNTTTYTCDVGYRGSGSGTSTCHADGTWSVPTLTCEIVDCNTPTPQPNMAGNSSSTIYGVTATYTCVPGYIETGDGTSTCRANGTWSVPHLICEAVDCNTPEVKPFMSSTFTSTLFGETATYTCNVGYTASGSGTSTCQANGTWSTTTLTCELVDCGPPVDAGQFVPVLYTNTTYESEATFACQLGMEPTTGDNKARCLAEGTWGLPTLQCGGMVDVVSQDISSGSTEIFVCEARMSGPSDVVDDARTQAPCEGSEILTGCTSRLDNAEPFSDGEDIEVVNGIATCVAINSWQATGPVRASSRCCSMSGLKCEYLQMPTSASTDNSQTTRTCKPGYWPTGCTAVHWHNQIDGVFLTDNGCVAQNSGPTEGVYGYAICCTAPNLNCTHVESVGTGHDVGDQASVSCPDDHTMLGCMSYSPDGGIQGSYIEAINGEDKCIVVNGQWKTVDETPPKAYASCCKID